MVRVALVFATAVLIVIPAAAQNLLANPGFDNADQLAGWSCYGTDASAAWTWSTDDRAGSADSGSVQHDISDPDHNNQTVNCNQCIPIDALHSYQGSLWNYWPDDPDVVQNGSTRISIAFYDDAGCTSVVEWGPVAVTNHPPYPLDTWEFLETTEGVAPANAVAARLNIVTWQDLANEPARGRIDDIDFRATTLFRDDFESGNTSGWEP